MEFFSVPITDSRCWDFALTVLSPLQPDSRLRPATLISGLLANSFCKQARSAHNSRLKSKQSSGPLPPPSSSSWPQHRSNVWHWQNDDLFGNMLQGFSTSVARIVAGGEFVVHAIRQTNEYADESPVRRLILWSHCRDPTSEVIDNVLSQHSDGDQRWRPQLCILSKKTETLTEMKKLPNVDVRTYPGEGLDFQELQDLLRKEFDNNPDAEMIETIMVMENNTRTNRFQSVVSRMTDQDRDEMTRSSNLPPFVALLRCRGTTWAANQTLHPSKGKWDIVNLRMFENYFKEKRNKMKIIVYLEKYFK